MRSRRSVVAALAAALCASLTIAGPAARSADKAPATLTSLGDSASWAGQFRNAVLPVPEPCPTSAEACDTMFVTLDLPAGTWATPGGMLVSIRWPEIDAFYDLDVYVYAPDEDLAAAGNALIYSQAEGAWIPNPTNGTYRIVVVPKTVVGPLPYEGSVILQRGATSSWTHTFAGTPVTQTSIDFGGSAGPDLLPNLVPTTPKAFHIESGVGATFYQSMNRGIRGPGSCYAQESTGATGVHDADTIGSLGNGPMRCLRFDQGEFNYGDGPFELRVYTGEGSGSDVYQAVYATDGSYSLRPVGTAIFHAAHGHFHYQNFSIVQLLDAATGEVVRTAADKGHCTVDILNDRFGEQGSSPNIYSFPGTCDADAHEDANDPLFPGSDYFRMGISVGWADVYPWFIPDQYVDITDLPDGRYLLRVQINADHHVAETTYADNTATTCVEIHGDAATMC